MTHTLQSKDKLFLLCAPRMGLMHENAFAMMSTGTCRLLSGESGSLSGAGSEAMMGIASCSMDDFGTNGENTN